jgi:hypothetical protein
MELLSGLLDSGPAFPSREVRQQADAAMREGTRILIGYGDCSIRGESTTVVAYVTGDRHLLRQVTERRHPVICAHCKLEIARDETFIRIGDSIYHQRCWDRIRSDRQRP